MRCAVPGILRSHLRGLGILPGPPGPSRIFTRHPRGSVNPARVAGIENPGQRELSRTESERGRSRWGDRRGRFGGDRRACLRRPAAHLRGASFARLGPRDRARRASPRLGDRRAGVRKGCPGRSRAVESPPVGERNRARAASAPNLRTLPRRLPGEQRRPAAIFEQRAVPPSPFLLPLITPVGPLDQPDA
jgi:hypothetical protein